MGILLLPVIIILGYIIPRIIIANYLRKYKSKVNFFPIFLVGYGFILFLLSVLLSGLGGTPTLGDYISIGLEFSIIVSTLYILYRWTDFHDNSNEKG